LGEIHFLLIILSSFEFVPMLIPVEVIEEAISKRDPFGDFERTLPFDMLFMVKFGTRIDIENDKGGWDEYILTNFRAVSRDAEEYSVDLRDFFNTEEKEIQAIKENYTVFRLKVDLPTRSQFVRSRVNLQELSRRFVSGKKLGFDFYVDEKIEELEECSKNNTGITFIIALNYGARDEIVRGIRKISRECAEGKIAPEDITEDMFNGFLDAHDIPDPDLLIRTSGELRLSNYLPWQLAYTEFYFTDVFWPDFNREELIKACEKYNKRDRRYGGVKEE
jgi:undecaprenyl diphosphate synthase